MNREIKNNNAQRSEKVRNLLGEIPRLPVILGIVVVLVILLTLIIVSYFVFFHHSQEKGIFSVTT